MPAFRFRILILAILVSCLLSAWAFASSKALSLGDLTYMTEEYFPFNYEEKGEIKGISVDLLHLTFQELGMKPVRLEILPWARGYDRVLHEQNTVLFSMARTEEREHLFQWAGPIMVVRFVLIARKDRNIKLKSLKDLKGYSIGTVREDVADKLLDDYKRIAKVQAVSDMKQNIKKIQDERLDMVAYDERSWQKFATANDLDIEDFETVYVLKEIPIYFAFHSMTSHSLVKRFQQALDKVKARPQYQHILDTYLK